MKKNKFKYTGESARLRRILAIKKLFIRWAIIAYNHQKLQHFVCLKYTDDLIEPKRTKDYIKKVRSWMDKTKINETT